jgi:hypothetical protein
MIKKKIISTVLRFFIHKSYFKDNILMFLIYLQKVFNGQKKYNPVNFDRKLINTHKLRKEMSILLITIRHDIAEILLLLR